MKVFERESVQEAHRLHPRDWYARFGTILAISLINGACVATPMPFGPAQLEIAGVDVKEETGNQDRMPNRGERLYLSPRFKNLGGLSSGELSVNMTVSSAGSARPFTAYPAVSSIDIKSIAGGATSAPSSSTYLGLELADDFPEETSVSLVFEVESKLGTKVLVPYQLYVPKVFNSMTLAEVLWDEETGNADGVPNRGERLYVKPRFKNVGGSATNDLSVAMATRGGVGTTFTAYPAVSSVDVSALGSGATSSKPTSVFFGLEIADDAEAGASIPLSFNVADKFGNTWTLEGAIEVEAIDVAIALAGIDIAEESGNGDGVPNRGERLYVKPRFKNSGGVGTNGLSVSMDVKGSGGETFTSYPAVSSLDVAAIAAGGTSAKPTSVFFGLEVSEETGPGSTIPVEFRLADRFGNEWTVDGEVKIK